jgi:hypothetical protein
MALRRGRGEVPADCISIIRGVVGRYLLDFELQWDKIGITEPVTEFTYIFGTKVSNDRLLKALF